MTKNGSDLSNGGKKTFSYTKVLLLFFSSLEMETLKFFSDEFKLPTKEFI